MKVIGNFDDSNIQSIQISSMPSRIMFDNTVGCVLGFELCISSMDKFIQRFGTIYLALLVFSGMISGNTGAGK